MRAKRAIPAKTPRPIGRTESERPGRTKAAAGVGVVPRSLLKVLEGNQRERGGTYEAGRMFPEESVVNEVGRGRGVGGVGAEVGAEVGEGRGEAVEGSRGAEEGRALGSRVDEGMVLGSREEGVRTAGSTVGDAIVNEAVEMSSVGVGVDSGAEVEEMGGVGVAERVA
jgi:hypothetical protein